MFTRSLRPMTDEERSEVQKDLTDILSREPKRTFANWLKSVFGWGVFFLLLGWGVAALLSALGLPQFVGRVAWIILGVLGFLIGNLQPEKEYRYWEKTRDTWTEHVRRGEMEVWSVEASAVICDLDANNYYFEIGDGQVLYLFGEGLYEAVIELENFPNTAFDIVRYPENGDVVRVICRGEVLEPLRTIDLDEEYWEAWPDDGTVIPTTLDKLEEALPRLYLKATPA